MSEGIMLVVFSTESDEPELLGEYHPPLKGDEGIVRYWEGLALKYASDDSVAIMEVDISILPNYKP